MKIQRFLPICMAALALCACGNEPEASSSQRTLTIEGSSTSTISFQPCVGPNCREDEIIFVHPAEVGEEKPVFQALYRDRGYIAFDGSRFTWNENGSSEEIGRKGPSGIELCNGAYENVCNLNLTVKHPDEAAAVDAEAVYLAEFGLTSEFRSDPGRSRTTLLKYVIPAPNQEDAGSCHYMASTGAMEILLNQEKDRDGLGVDKRLNGSTDLSEAYLMNIPESNGDKITGLRKILGFNNADGRGLSNSRFPFWNSANGNKARDNWNREVVHEADISTPEVMIHNIYGGSSISDGSKWDVAVFSDREIEAVKEELRKDRPVLVTYNHFGYWHVVVIAGFDDTISQGCSWVTQFIENKGSGTSFPKYQAAVKEALEANGGCRTTGVFYVRDSLGWGGDADRATSYSPRSYEWLRYLGNHAYSVSVKDSI